MSSKNTWDGLQFRVMETLEQAKGVPLTSIEISQRLHETEYKHELYDNVMFKVTRACHAMREKGRIIVADARDRDGRLTYVLPKRVIFPRKDTDMPPANPVLKPEMAEKIMPVQPKEDSKPEKPKKAATDKPSPNWGVSEKIVALLDAAPHPLVSTEIIEVAKQQKWWPEGVDVRNGVAQILYHLSESKQAFRLPKSSRTKGRGVKYEYATRKTGHYSAPASKATTTPKKPGPRPAPAPVTANSGHSAVRSAAPTVFRPGHVQVARRQLNIDIPSDKYDQYKAAAEQFNVTLTQFCIDAMDFALSHVE